MRMAFQQGVNKLILIGGNPHYDVMLEGLHPMVKEVHICGFLRYISNEITPYAYKVHDLTE